MISNDLVVEKIINRTVSISNESWEPRKYSKSKEFSVKPSHDLQTKFF